MFCHRRRSSASWRFSNKRRSLPGRRARLRTTCLRWALNVPGPVVAPSAWYDRDVSAALLAPRIRRIEQATDRALVNAERVLDVWTLIDPRAAAAWLERAPMTSTNPNDNFGWIYVVEKLSLDRDECWRKTFLDWAPVFNPANRDVMFDRF